mgnify:CR=1 FL=1
MNFVVAGVALLLSFAVGVISYILVPVFQEDYSDDAKEGSMTSPAITIPSFFEKRNQRKILFVCGTSVLCCVCAWLLLNSGTDAFVFLRQMCVLLVLLFSMIIDIETQIIPNIVILISLGIGIVLLVSECVFSREKFLDSLIMSFAGLLCCMVLFYVLSRLTKEGIGMGDVKLISVMGFMTGMSLTLMAVLLSLILCTVTSILLLLRKIKNKNDRIPFGPFMFFGYIFMLILFNV